MTPTSLPHDDSPGMADEHAQLRDMLRLLAASFADRQSTGEQLAELLERSRDQLESHFAHEETGGYFEGIREAAPRLSDRVNELEHEHPQFLALIDQMRSRALSHEATDVWRDECERLFREFRESFLAHEAGEHDLMQEAYSQDIGDND
jgi:hemerythrin